MQTLHFSILIDASRATVWSVMLAPETYRLWTAEFMEGSYYEGSWGEGDHIRFLTPEGSGMVAEIAENRLHEFISIRHLGLIENGVEDLDSKAVKSWAPAYENYSFAEGEGCTDADVDDCTELSVAMDVLPAYADMMAKVWPRALDRLKELCEAPSTQASS